MPPNICLTAIIATAQPKTAISGLSPDGRLSAKSKPVTTALKSPIVFFLFITLRQIYSITTQDITHTAISIRLFQPKKTVAAIDAGTREMMTSSIILLVVAPLDRCGDDETVNMFSIIFPP